MIGTVVGNYKVVEKIGEGGMGAVYKGVDLMLEREVAIKVLKPELASQPQVVERFRSEAVTLAKLNHPNIATLYNFFRQGDYFFMVLEYVNGTPLEKIIEANGVMTCEQAIPLFCQMLEGIEHAHSFGIIHRDIKPANMMLTQSGLLKVLDFGIARALGSARMTRAGHLIGTIEYMSPEQVRGFDTDARSDIYSLGMVLYEMLTGRVPFASDSEFELMKAQVEQLPTPPREFSPSIPEQVEWAILCATEKDPSKRFQTADAFGGAIVDSVTSAMATGELSEIAMRGSTKRLSAAVVGRDLKSRTSANSSSGFQSNYSAEQRTSNENEIFPPPTRFVPTENETPAVGGHLKATRLGNFSDLPAGNFSSAEAYLAPAPSRSIFDKLGSKPFLFAGLGLGVVLLGLLAIAFAVFLGSGRSSTTDTDPAAASSPVDQRSPTNSEEDLQRRTTDSQVGSKGFGNQQPDSNQSVRDLQSVEPPPRPSAEPRKTNKPRTSAQSRTKRRPSSRDIMGAP